MFFMQRSFFISFRTIKISTNQSGNGKHKKTELKNIHDGPNLFICILIKYVLPVVIPKADVHML